MAGEVSDPCDETVCHGGPLGLEQIKCLAGVGGVGAHQRRSGDQRGQQPERESADPEERRIAEQPVVRGQSADRVEVHLVFEQGGVGVHHALGHAGRTRRVDDRERIGSVDVVFHRLQQRLVDGGGRFRIDQHMAQLGDGGVVDVGQPLAEVVAAVGRGGEKDRHVTVDELFAHLRRRGERRERDHHRPDPGGGQHSDHELRAVRVEHADMGALPRAEGNEATGQSRRPAVGLRVAEAVGVANQEWVLTPGVRLHSQDLCDGVRLSRHGWRSDRACRTASEGSRRRSRSR